MRVNVFLFLLVSVFCADAMAAIKVNGTSVSGNSYVGGSDTVIKGLGSTETKASVGDENSFARLQKEIEKLEEELGQKQETLEACANKNKNFKLAGITTLGLTGAGAAGNIIMYRNFKKGERENNNILTKLDSANSSAPEITKEELASIDAKAHNADKECLKKKGFSADYTETYSKKYVDITEKIQNTNKEDFESGKAKGLIEQKTKLNAEFKKFLNAVENCQQTAE